MKLFLCVLTILFQHFITPSGGVTKNTKKEPKKLYQLMCQDLTEAIEYRKTAFWQKLAKIDYTKMHEKVLSKYMEWQIRYASIERLFKYCEYLTKCENNIYAKYYYFRNENKSLKHIALKPTFTSTNDGILSIKEVMTNIVLAFQIIFMSKKEKCLEKCFKICMDKKKLVEMNFENKEECVKVLAWAHHLASSQHIEDALNNLRNVKTHLLSLAVNEKVVKLVVNMPPPQLIEEHSENPSKNDHKIRTNIGTYTEQNSVDQFLDQLQFQLMMAQLSNTRSTGCTSAAGGSGGGDGFFCCINSSGACCKGCGVCCGECCKGCGACCSECCKSFGECCKGFGECCKGFGECFKGCGEGCKGFVEGCKGYCCECCKNCSECCKSFVECCNGCCECCKGCKDCCEGFGECCKTFGECCNGCCECCKNCSECCKSFGECCRGCCACCKDCSECCKGLGECCKGCGECCKGLGECCKGCGECCKGLGECCKGCGECCQVR